MIDRYLIDGVIREGVSCGNCRYDLRGQRRYGRCPECGRGVDDTLRALDEAYRPLLGHAWLTQVWEGSVLLLIGTGMLAVLAVVPEAMFAWRSVERVIMLGWICTAWVLGWYGGWKLASREQDGPLPPRMALVVRGLLALYLLAPMIMGLENYFEPRSSAVTVAEIVCGISGGFAGVPMLWLWSNWFWRSGRKIAGRLLEVLAALSPFVLVYQGATTGTLDGDESSMKLILGLPVVPMTTGEFARAWHGLVQYPNAVLWILPGVAYVVVLIGLNVALMRVLHRARKQSDEPRLNRPK